VINEERLRQFEEWLGEKGDDPKTVLTLRWIAEFIEAAEEDEEELREFKDWLKTRGDSGSLRTLRIVAEFEETQDDEEGLEQFKRWLQAKGNHPHVVMALWWIAEFTESEDKDPPRWPLTPQLH
jgi:hypothetical protein